ncbi:MAG: hypothetical protein EA427_17230 [Spirochaetaceae bacterium]|nr:MAG: hypothetical protein EA427_17230 [Spirochaetaceae bacterium]
MNRRPSDVVTALIATKAFLFALAGRLHGERYDLVRQPLSRLGGLTTAAGYSNSPGYWFFIAAMFLGAGFSLWYARRYCASGMPARSFLHRVCIVAALGFVLTALPFDVPRLYRIHGYGAGMAFGGFWTVGNVQLMLARRFQPGAGSAGARVLFLILNVPFLVYSALVLLDLPVKVFAQKFAAAGIALGTHRASIRFENLWFGAATRPLGLGPVPEREVS